MIIIDSMRVDVGMYADGIRKDISCKLEGNNQREKNSFLQYQHWKYVARGKKTYRENGMGFQSIPEASRGSAVVETTSVGTQYSSVNAS